MHGGDASVATAMATLLPGRPPLSLRDISPSRGEISRTFRIPSSVRRATKRMAISPLAGEMSRSDRGGYSTQNPSHPVPSFPQQSR